MAIRTTDHNPKRCAAAINQQTPFGTAFRTIGGIGAGCTPAQLCLAWLMVKDSALVSIPGTTRMDHMLENAGAAEMALSADMIARVDALGGAVTGSRYPAALQASVDTERMPGE